MPDLSSLRRRAVLICIATTSLVALTELFVGWYFRLISVGAEGLHTFADLADSLVAWVLVAMASRPADREHPFGYGKYDSLAAIVEGTCVGATALWALWKASQVLLGFAAAEPRPEIAAILAMAAASGFYFLVSTYALHLAKVTQSPAVYAEAMHLRTHIFITIGLAIGLVLSRVGLAVGWRAAERIDAMVALVLGAYLLSVAYKIIRPGYRQLMDTALPPDEIAAITNCLNEFRDEFVEVHAVRTRRAGTDRHVDIHLVVEVDMTVEAAHALSHRIEERLVSRFPGVRLLVHVEPAVGEPWAAFLKRQRVGIVLVGERSPVEREATHHSSERAHEL